jgi:hypothetical protein
VRVTGNDLDVAISGFQFNVDTVNCEAGALAERLVAIDRTRMFAPDTWHRHTAAGNDLPVVPQG